MKINITIMGKTGNGKSTIVNAIAGTKLADTGKGGRVKPVQASAAAYAACIDTAFVHRT